MYLCMCVCARALLCFAYLQVGSDRLTLTLGSSVITDTEETLGVGNKKKKKITNDMYRLNAYNVATQALCT